jgi:hypothetical protein
MRSDALTILSSMNTRWRSSWGRPKLWELDTAKHLGGQELLGMPVATPLRNSQAGKRANFPARSTL